MDVAVIDAPVSGSRPAADAGTLTVMAGGDQATLERLQPLFDAFAANVVRAGEVGAGQALKIANNVMLHMNYLVALEAVRFARSQGVDEATLIATANISSGRSWVTETWGLLDAMMIDHPLAGTDADLSVDVQGALALGAVGPRHPDLVAVDGSRHATHRGASACARRQEVCNRAKRPGGAIERGV